MDFIRPTRRELVRVMLLDDHPVVRCGFERRLACEADIAVVGSYENSRELMAALRRERCDVLVLDYLLDSDDIDGALLVRYVQILHPQVRMLMSSAYVNGPTINACLKAGATGFFSKSAWLEELVRGVRAVAAGETFLGRDAETVIAERKAARGNTRRRPIEMRLTLKEQEVLRCCLQGLSVTKIAAKFRRSVKTVSGHKVAAFRKLGIESDAKLFLARKKLEGL
jgi:two-component system capsular synthesis response regulator RcsB